MRVKIRLIMLALPIFFASFNVAQTLHTVEVSDFVFTPSDLTIMVNDTVRWVNQGGNHNVVADDASFTSGAPSTAAWVYERVFTSAGSNPYYCVNHGGPGGTGMSGVITVQDPTGVEEDNFLPLAFELKQNFPNPFNPTTNIQYNVAKSGNINLTVFNSIGEEVSILVNGFKEVGSYEVSFSALTLTSGIYFYKLEANDFIQVRKMILMK